jgi:Txe/YoeB family toxin of Txe-Axe toxin-antitoxin module
MSNEQTEELNLKVYKLLSNLERDPFESYKYFAETMILFKELANAYFELLHKNERLNYFYNQINRNILESRAIFNPKPLELKDHRCSRCYSREVRIEHQNPCSVLIECHSCGLKIDYLMDNDIIP